MITLTKEAAQTVLDALKSAMSSVYDPTSNAAKRLNPAIATLQAAIDAPEPSGEREKIIKELRQAHAGHTDEGPSTFSDAADMLAADAPQAREPSGEHLSDALSRSMHVLEAVDVYHERPDRMNRTALRIVIMDEFEAALLAARSEP